ncbi:DUF4158 domain-containing protein [Streptomyces sp. 4N509B]|uniref:DUF4158 domain-containing protein n=1 Tax=Streptomyces sp. 4N509B TaxID=3457413 RepID=UPI003FD29814
MLDAGDGDWDLVANKSGPTRLGFCLMLKFFEIEGRFPEFVEEFPQPAVEYVAELVKVPAGELAEYDLRGPKRHRKQIREALGFRPATLADEESLTVWLAAEVCPVELVAEGNDEGTALLAALKRDPGAVGLDSLLTEITKVNAVRELGLPAELFADCSEKMLSP